MYLQMNIKSNETVLYKIYRVHKMSLKILKSFNNKSNKLKNNNLTKIWMKI